MTDEYYCKRCGHEWLGIRRNAPKVCPKCKSYEWNKPKKPTKNLTGDRESSETSSSPSLSDNSKEVK